jgi:hypothetical protein
MNSLKFDQELITGIKHEFIWNYIELIRNHLEIIKF